MSVPVQISSGEARRLALGAQGLGAPRPSSRLDIRQVRRVVQKLGAVQIDAVNVLVRSHYLPVYSRLGSYPLDAFDRLAYQRRELFEYLGHAASFVPTELHPVLRWRMTRYANGKHWRAAVSRIESGRPGYVAAVEDEIRQRGPLALSDLSDPAKRERTPTKYAESSLLWYRWSDGKTVLDGLFEAGLLSVSGRRNFERLYDLTERVIPPAILEAPTPGEEDAQRVLVRRAATALGVAAIRDLADYFRLPMATTRARVGELVASGDLLEASVEGWREQAYLDPTTEPSTGAAAALLSPFDSLVWERSRVERIFGFSHSFELYVPAAKRRYGYYVLPFLLGDALVGRVDLKADRDAGTLVVLSAHLEPAISAGAVVDPLADELGGMARWLGLDGVEVRMAGTLAESLRSRLA